MKSNLFTMRGLLLTSLLGAASVCAPGAQASFIVTIAQVGADVVVTGPGSLDLAGMSDASYANNGHIIARSGIEANDGAIGIGSPGFDPVDIYTGSISGPSSFGTTGFIGPSDSGSGDKLVLHGIGDEVEVAAGYISGDPLSDSETFDNATLASLGLTVGSYTWTLPSDSYTIDIEAPVAAPEPASLTLLAAGAGMTLLAARRRRRSAV